MLFELIAFLTGTVVISLIAGFVVVFVATYMFQNREKSNVWAHNLLVDGIFIFYSVLAIGVVISPAMFILKPFIFIYEITVRFYNEGLPSVLTSPTLDENETMYRMHWLITQCNGTDKGGQAWPPVLNVTWNLRPSIFVLFCLLARQQEKREVGL